MNYLAHVLLSGSEPDWQLGGYLGDFIKGPLHGALLDQQGEPWSDSVLGGVLLHRKLDVHIDRQPGYMQCVELLGPEYRRVGGIVMDVIFDHLLVHHWERFGSGDLLHFSQSFYQYCQRYDQRLPQRAQNFVSAAARHDLFVGYGDSKIITAVLQRIAGRMRYQTNLELAGQVALHNLQPIESLFLQLMPELIEFAAAFRRQHPAG